MLQQVDRVEGLQRVNDFVVKFANVNGAACGHTVPPCPDPRQHPQRRQRHKCRGSGLVTRKRGFVFRQRRRGLPGLHQHVGQQFARWQDAA